MDILRFPLVRFTLFFIAGIVCAYWFSDEIKLNYACAVVLILLAASYSYAKRSGKSIAFGIVSALAGLFCGGLTNAVHNYSNQPGHYVAFIGDDHSYCELTIAERLKNGTHATRYFADVAKIDGQATHGKILLHFKDKARLPIGTKLIAVGKIVRHKPPLNPGQFDYGKYLENKSVPAQLYLNRNYNVVATVRNLGFYADRVRSKIIQTLRLQGFHESELQVLHALILGQQQEIDPEIVKDYQFAGAVHVLSVSGLHVGFVLVFVQFALGRLPRTPRWNTLRVLLIILSLWSFALVAGMSPSVVRSATMFSFVAIGMNLRRSTNAFHTLIVSMLLILIFEPSFITDVGFQLSYCALFFILWLQPSLSNIWSPDNQVARYFWDIVTVSFAAQIGTLPLSIYYFHQFPALFFVTNLIVIPMLSLIMAVGIVVMIPAAFGYSIPILTTALEWGISLLNRMISLIASFEDFVLKAIPCNLPLLLSGYAVIIAMVLWWKTPKPVRFLVSLTAVFSFQVCLLATLLSPRFQSEFIVFDVSKKTLIAERTGRRLSIYGEPNRVTDAFAISRFVNRTNDLSKRNTFWYNGQRLLVVDNTNMLPGATPTIVILSQSPKINFDRWIQKYKPKQVVADASNYKSDVMRWKRTCAKRKIPFHYTREKGSFKLSESFTTYFDR